MSKKTKKQGPSPMQEGLQNTKKHMVSSQKNAQEIFMTLVENTLSPEMVAERLCYINPDTYDEIVTNRGASGICGYPLCGQDFTDNYGDQKFKIRNNKVYDIIDRRNFCSDVCFEASEIVKQQVSKEPLFVRESESLSKDSLKVVIPDVAKLRGRYGKQIDIAGGINIPYMSHAKTTRSFMSFSDVAEEGLKMCVDNKEEGEESKIKTDTVDESKIKTDTVDESKIKTDTVDESKIKTDTVDESKIKTDTVDESKRDKVSQQKEAGKSNTSKVTKERTHEWRQPAKEVEQKRQNHDTQMAVFEIENAMRDWMTFESLRLILGDTYVKGMLEHIGAKWEDYDSAEGMKLSVEAKAKYIALCRKLDEEERDDRSAPDLDVREVSGHPKCPLPDYQQLQEDAKKQQLKVVSFLGGQDQYEDVSDAQSKKTGADDSSGPLPLIDHHSQVEWRQSIVFEKLENYMRPYLPMTQLDESKLKVLMKNLIWTFNFTPNNIIFKPGQWNFVTLLLLKMLSIRIPAIKSGMELPEFIQFQETFLSNFHLEEGYLDRFLCYVTEIGPILNRSLTKDNAQDPHSVNSLEQSSLSGNLMKMSVIEEENSNEKEVKEKNARNLMKMSVINEENEKELEDKNATKSRINCNLRNEVSSAAEDLD